MQHGATVEELQAVALAASTTWGFPTAVAALRWIQDVVSAGERAEPPGPGA